MVVSLEAIFLSTFVLIGQNHLARMSERRSELDLQVNLLAEQKSAKTLEVLDHLAQQLEQVVRRFNYTTDPEVAALKTSLKPQDVLQVIEDAIKEETGEILTDINRAVGDVTSEVKIVREDVAQVREAVEDVAEEVEEIRENIEHRKDG